MTSTRRSARAAVHRRRMRWARVVAVFALALFVVGVGITALALAASAGPSPQPHASASADPTNAAPTATPVPALTPPPLSPAERLLAASGDPHTCAVTFAGEAIAVAPVLETQGALYQHLPIPQRDGFVFGGWYATPGDAAAFTVAQRVNGADAVACVNRRATLFASWKTPEEVAALNVGVPILMYHQFTTKPQGEKNWLKANYVYVGDFDAHMRYLAEAQIYLPTWDELSAFIDGKLYIPRNCAIVTDDDADPTWTELAAPIVAQHKILTTSFVITTAYPGPPPNQYVLQRSHTHDMHSAGANGKGRIVNWSTEQIVGDMTTSAGVIGGAKQVMAYPYGHFNDTAKEGLRQAGFEIARTTQPGYVRVGADKLALPTQRINHGMGLHAFIKIVG